MPKDDREIHSAIRLPGIKEGKRYTKGSVITDPDDLVKSGVDLQSLYESGAISGTWKGVKAAHEDKAEETKKGK